MFESLPTLHNCFMFANVTAGRFREAGSNQTAADLHYLDEERNATVDNVARVLEDCLLKYCDTLPNCNQETREINSDVGGIGAFNYGWSAAGSRSLHLNQVAQKHLARLVAALTNFHKAQCFFVMAINVAALVVVQRGGFDPQSLQQIYDTYVFLQVLAVNGFLPITFTLTNLYLVGMLSWFLILLSTVTVALSVATLASVGHLDPSKADMRSLATLAASGGPQECDGRKPGVYCLRNMEYNLRVGYFYGD
ncbi:MAG: hypothetical protein Q9208_004857 [Pyrenodesmia sp. 3 TL-2023]